MIKGNRWKEHREILNFLLFTFNLRVSFSFRILDLGVGLLPKLPLSFSEVLLKLGSFSLENLHELTLGHRALAVLYLS